MKKLLLFISIISLLSCSLDDGVDTTPNSGKWNLINISGGVSGNQINLQRDEVTWVFDEANDNLIVEYNINDDPASLPKSGTYNYEIKEVNNGFFLFLNDNEVGNLVVGSNRLTIDQNVRSDGNASDLYVLTFVR